jgi:ABC-type sugar transport system ATPase subunit
MTIVGPSGSGKTLLLKAIAGLEPVQAGAIFMGKTQIDSLPVAARKLGFVFENYALFPHLNAKRNIEFPRILQKHFVPTDQRNSDTFIEAETKKRIQELNIESSYLNRLPKQLPEGMKQLVAIARERNHELELFLMDEPMTRLDTAQHVQMRIFIRKIVRDFGKTTIISSNDPEDALILSDYIGIMAEGKLLQFGETWEVYHHPVNLMAMEMTSRLAVNTVRVEIADGKIRPYNLPADREDGTYLMAFRPEEIEITEQGIPATISFSRFFDGTRKQAFCAIGEDSEVNLMLPINKEGSVSFVPTHPQFFHIEEE